MAIYELLQIYILYILYFIFPSKIFSAFLQQFIIILVVISVII
jgi:hypothetical protein